MVVLIERNIYLTKIPQIILGLDITGMTYKTELNVLGSEREQETPLI